MGWAILKWLGGKLLLPAMLFAAAYFAGRHAGTLAERVIWQTREAQAQLDALKAKGATETRNAVISQEHSDDLKAKLDDARVRANALVARLRASTDGGTGNLPRPASSPTGTDGAFDPAELADDIPRCTDAYVVAQGWQDWWRDISAESVNGASR